MTRPTPRMDSPIQEEACPHKPGDSREAGGGIETRQALLEAALSCFSAHGFEGTSIRDIAHRAGRNSSLISHHFGSKEGLYVEVFRHIFRTRHPASQATAEEYRPPQDRAEALQSFREQIRLLVLEFNPSPEQSESVLHRGRRLFLHELQEPRPQVTAILRVEIEPWIRKFSDCLRILRPALDEAQRNFLGVSIMGEMISHVLLDNLHAKAGGEPGLSVAQIVDLLTEFNLRAVGVTGDDFGERTIGTV